MDLADAYQKIGDVQGNPYNANLGDVEGARASYTKLVDLRRAIHDARRDRPSAVGLGRAHSRLGDLDLGRAKYPEAVDSYQRALALFDAGGSGQAGSDDTAEDRARVYNRKGVALTWSGRRAEARTALEEAIRLTELFTSRPGASRVMRRGLAVSNANLGDVFHYEKDFERALRAHQRGADLSRLLLKEARSRSLTRPHVPTRHVSGARRRPRCCTRSMNGAFQQGGGSAEDHGAEIARLSAALELATKNLSR